MKWRRAGRAACRFPGSGASCHVIYAFAIRVSMSAARGSSAPSKASTRGSSSTSATTSTESYTPCGCRISRASDSWTCCSPTRTCRTNEKLFRVPPVISSRRLLWLQELEEILLQLQQGLRVGKRIARDTEHVLDTFAQRDDFRRVQADLVLPEQPRNAVKQSGPVARADG